MTRRRRWLVVPWLSLVLVAVLSAGAAALGAASAPTGTARVHQGNAVATSGSEQLPTSDGTHASSCPTPLPAQPVYVNGQFCDRTPGPGNGEGPKGLCTGAETSPPCGPGAVIGTYYPFTLPTTCTGTVWFDGREWVSELPPPVGAKPVDVWVLLAAPTRAGWAEENHGAVGFKPYAGQALPACTPPASTTTTTTAPATTTTAAPAQTASTAVPLVVCPTTGPATTPAPTSLPSTERLTVPTALVGKVALYSDNEGRMMLLGPAGWQCSAVLFEDGREEIDVSPPTQAPSAISSAQSYVPSRAEGVRATYIWALGGQLDTACPFFPAARATFARTYPGISGCRTAPPATESVDQIGANAVAFKDPVQVAGDGVPSGGPYPANGVVTYDTRTSTPARGVQVDTCTLPASEAQVCTLSLDTFVAEYATR